MDGQEAHVPEDADTAELVKALNRLREEEIELRRELQVK